mgnify:CR=1 FL=1
MKTFTQWLETTRYERLRNQLEKSLKRVVRQDTAEPVKIVRYTHADGKGILNNSGLDLSKLNDEEDQELAELRGFGLQQPLEVPPNAVFFFTEEGEKKHSRLLELLKKSSIKGVVRTKSTYTGKPLWQSSDGQVAVDPSQVVEQE